MTIPEVPFIIDCVSAFALPARYTITMLGLIAGYSPRFVNKSQGEMNCIYYGYKPSGLYRTGTFLPASIHAHEFLLRKGILTIEKPNEIKYYDRQFVSLFPITNESDFLNAGAEVPLLTSDIIANAFFFLSLHEEWSTPDRDIFDRFQAKDSFLGKHEMLDRPVVAEYAAAISALIKSAGFNLPLEPRFDGAKAAVCFTHDIDYITKRTAGIFYRETLKNFLLNKAQLPFFQRTRRLIEYFSFFLPGHDPYRISLGKMLEHEANAGIGATYFFKTGGKDKRDVSYNINSRTIQKFIMGIENANHEIGFHPSFRTYCDSQMIQTERNLLAPKAGSEPESVRQHYLRFRYPETWKIQCAANFRIDSTLGFAEKEGFRNGTCHPFLPYDLETHSIIPIWELPLSVMDGTLAHYRMLNADESIRIIERTIQKTIEARGIAVILFHNTCYDPHDFPGWDIVFESTVRRVKAEDIMTASVHETLSAWIKPFGISSINDCVARLSALQ